MKFTLFFLLTVGGLAACGEVADTRPGQPVKSRQMAFKEIVKHFEPMGVMLRKGQFNAERFASLAAAFKERQAAPWPHFGPDTNYPPTKATAEVWAQPDAFEKERQAFLAAGDRLVAAAQTQDRDRVVVAYEVLHDTCKHCHRQFKQN